MESTKLFLLGTVIVFMLVAGMFCMVFGAYALINLAVRGNTEVRVGKHVSVSTPLPAVVVFLIGLTLFLAAGWLAHDKIVIAELKGGLSKQQYEVAALRQSLQQDAASLAKRLETDETVNAQVQGELAVMTERLRLTQSELKRAREVANRIREENAQQLAAMDTAVKGELANKASTEEVKAISGEVGVVRSDLDATKQNLHMAKSEMGTLIARNHEQIEQLRRLGERDYIEFTVQGRGKPQKVANITLELRSVNPKRNLFTLALVADDVRVEKRNRTINEPIFFYTRGAKQPIELVVYEVAENKVVGYLSLPKSSQ